jgi:hypothetical protein
LELGVDGRCGVKCPKMGLGSFGNSKSRECREEDLFGAVLSLRDSSFVMCGLRRRNWLELTGAGPRVQALAENKGGAECSKMGLGSFCILRPPTRLRASEGEMAKAGGGGLRWSRRGCGYVPWHDAPEWLRGWEPWAREVVWNGCMDANTRVQHGCSEICVSC